MLELDYGGSFADLPKRTLYQKISLYKQNKFQRATDFTRNDMIKTMKKAAKCLKKIDMIKMRSDIEIERYGNTSVPAFLWQEEYIANFYFFIVINHPVMNEANAFVKRYMRMCISDIWRTMCSPTGMTNN